MTFLVHSFIELTKYIFNLPGVKLFLSERLTQDPLESFFGKQRQRGRGSDNPTVSQFLNSTASLRVQGSLALQPFRGNSTRKRKPIDLSNCEEPLQKRKRRKT